MSTHSRRCDRSARCRRADRQIKSMMRWVPAFDAVLDNEMTRARPPRHAAARLGKHSRQRTQPIASGLCLRQRARNHRTCSKDPSRKRNPRPNTLGQSPPTQNRPMCHSACHLRNGVSGTALPPTANATAIVEKAPAALAMTSRLLAKPSFTWGQHLGDDRPNNQGLSPLEHDVFHSARRYHALAPMTRRNIPRHRKFTGTTPSEGRCSTVQGRLPPVRSRRSAPGSRWPRCPYFVTADGRDWTPIRQAGMICWEGLAGLYRRRDPGARQLSRAPRRPWRHHAETDARICRVSGFPARGPDQAFRPVELLAG